MSTHLSVSGGADLRPSKQSHPAPRGQYDHIDSGERKKVAKLQRAGRSGQTGVAILLACFICASMAMVFLPVGRHAADHDFGRGRKHDYRGAPNRRATAEVHVEVNVAGGAAENPDAHKASRAEDRRGTAHYEADNLPDRQEAEVLQEQEEEEEPQVEVDVEVVEDEELAALRETIQEQRPYSGKSSGGGDPIEDAEEGVEGEEEKEAAPPIGERRGNWRWTGAVWRKIRTELDGSEGEREEISWWERRTVQDRLNFDKYINCKHTKEKTERPHLQGLPLRMKWKIDDYIVHQGNYIALKKGPEVNRTQRIRNVDMLPRDGDSVLDSPGQWGNCAVVGNSGVLRLTELSRAIESHNTIVRINQAPTFGYSRRVGRKVTHRVINKLWTRTYRNGGGMKHGTTLPMERDLTFMVARATSQEYELLVDFINQIRPDVKIWYLSSRATTGPTPLLTGYRERLCKAGYGPYKGLNVPSSGFVAIIMLLPLCDRVTVYGFGVEGMGAKKTDDGYGYHYYKGVGMRHVGDDVHCFDCEEKVLQQMGAEGVIDFCTYEPGNATNSWACGCRHEDQTLCKPPPRPTWLRESDDCDPGFDDCDEVKAERLKKMADRERGKGLGSVEGGRQSGKRSRGSRRPTS